LAGWTFLYRPELFVDGGIRYDSNGAVAVGSKQPPPLGSSCPQAPSRLQARVLLLDDLSSVRKAVVPALFG